MTEIIMVPSLEDTSVMVPGWEYWFKDKITPGRHEIGFIPHSVSDGWAAWCQCGQWRAFASYYEASTQEELFGLLRAKHALHCEEAGQK
ncbi:MAG: hypothetical protein ABII76_01580 [Pseudomonadota bacterium]